MFEPLVEKNPALLIPILSVVGAAVVFLVWIIAHYWAKIRRMELEAALKKDMLNRGLSPAEIERVLLASATARPQQKEIVSDNEYHLVEKLVDAEYASDEIERVVRAFKLGEKVEVRLPDRLLS